MTSGHHHEATRQVADSFASQIHLAPCPGTSSCQHRGAENTCTHPPTPMVMKSRLSTNCHAAKMGHFFVFYHLQTVNFQKFQKRRNFYKFSLSPLALHLACRGQGLGGCSTGTVPRRAPPDRMTRPAVQSAGEEGDFAHDDCTLTPNLSPSKLLSTDLLSVLFP